MPRSKQGTINRREKDTRSGADKKKQLDFLYRKYEGICQLCFEPCIRAEASREHVKALALCTKTEARDTNNMVLAHIKCNNDRHRNLQPSEEEEINGLKQLTYTIGDLFPNLAIAYGSE